MLEAALVRCSWWTMVSGSVTAAAHDPPTFAAFTFLCCAGMRSASGKIHPPRCNGAVYREGPAVRNEEHRAAMVNAAPQEKATTRGVSRSSRRENFGDHRLQRENAGHPHSQWGCLEKGNRFALAGAIGTSEA